LVDQLRFLFHFPVDHLIVIAACYEILIRNAVDGVNIVIMAISKRKIRDLYFLKVNYKVSMYALSFASQRFIVLSQLIEQNWSELCWNFMPLMVPLCLIKVCI